MKKGKKRERVKYPGLVKGVNSKARHEYMDFDYLGKLNSEEKQWLSNFMEEYMSGNFKHQGDTLHKTKEQKKACYDRNNARNRCMLTKAKATGRVDYVTQEQTDVQDEGEFLAAKEAQEAQVKEMIAYKKELRSKIEKLENQLEVLYENLSRLDGTGNNRKRSNKFNNTH